MKKHGVFVHTCAHYAGAKLMMQDSRVVWEHSCVYCCNNVRHDMVVAREQFSRRSVQLNVMLNGVEAVLKERQEVDA